MSALARFARSLVDPAAYRRITSGGQFVPEVDGIRFVAIVTVILFHLNTHFKRTFADAATSGYLGSPLDLVIQLGDTGVLVFFALSGFILSLPFARAHAGLGPPVRLGRYFVRRLTRLEPPFILSTLGIFGLLVVTRIITLPDAWPHLAATLTYTHAIIYGAWSTINPVTWSLETEVQFYIVAPALAAMFVVKDPRLRVLILAGAWIASALLPDREQLAPAHLEFSLAAFLHVFLIGFLFCELYVRWQPWLRAQHRAFDVIGALALIGVFLDRGNERFVFGPLLLLFFVAVFKGPRLNRWLTDRWVTAIGGACYSLYLLHYAIIFATMTVTSRLVLPWFAANLVVQFAIALLAVLVIGMTFFRWAERPFMRPAWPQELGQQVRRSMARERATP